MPASSFADRISGTVAFTRQAHQGFGVDAKKRGAFLEIDIGSGRELPSPPRLYKSFASRRTEIGF